MSYNNPLLTVVFASVCSNLAIAQSGGSVAGANGSDRRNVLIEEVVVTAQKREENLQQVPLSLQAFSGEKLEALGVDNAVDLPRITPGLVLTETIGYVTTYIRGLGSDAFAFADPSVAVYIDGIYNPSATTATQDFGPVERVEVLKGPQGTLFGRNAIGGAINVVTKRVPLEEPEASVSVISDDLGSMRTAASIGLPITDTLGFRLSGLYNELDPQVDGSVDGVAIDETLQKGGRLKVLWAPFEWFELNLAASEFNSRGAAGNYVANTNPSLLGTALGIQGQDPYRNEINEFPENAGFEETLYSANANFFFDTFDVKLFASEQEVESRQGLDFDGSPMPVALLAVNPRISEVTTAEFQVVSNEGSWMSDRLDWIFGGYYFESYDGYQDSVLKVAETQVLGEQITILGLPIPAGFGELLGFLNGLPVPTGTLGFSGLLDTESTSLFFQTTYRFTDSLALTLGGRWQKEERGIAESTSYARLANGGRLNIPGQDFRCSDDAQYCDTTEDFNPRVSLEFSPSDDFLIYGNWQTATKASTFNSINIYDTPEFVPAETVTAYEVGFKSTLFDQVRFNAAAFHYEIEDLQVQFVSLLTGGALTFEPAEEASVTGFEFDALFEVLPNHIDNLVMTIGGTFLDAKYDTLEDANGFDPETGAYVSNGSYSGNQITRSPDFTGNITLNKMFVTEFGAIEAGVDYYHNSGFYFLADNNPNDEQPKYGLLGARVTAAIDDWGLRLSVFGKNMTNEEYFHTRLPTDFGALDYPAAKAVYGLQAKWEL